MRQSRAPVADSRLLVAGSALVLTAVSAALRFYRLDGRSLWLDEIFQAEAARLATPGQVVALVQSYLDQMPLFFMITWALGHWSDSAFALRLPSAIAGTLAAVAVFALGRRLFGLRYGITAGLLMSVMTYGLWYSQEARDYALLMLLTILQMHFAFLIVRRGSATDWIGLTIVTVLNVYNHYLALLVTATVAFYVAGFGFAYVFRRVQNRYRVAMTVGVLLLAVAAKAVRWRPLLRTLYSYVFGAVAQHPARIAALVLALIAAAAVVAFVFDRRLRARNRFVAELGQIELALASALFVGLTYLPWLPSLHSFLSAPNLGFSRVQATAGVDGAQVLTMLQRLGWSGLLLAAFAAGLVTLAIWTFRGRAAESLLILGSLTVPIGFLVVSGGASVVNIDIRYLAFLFPAMTLVGAAGVEGVARGIELLLRRSSLPHMPAVSAGLTVAVIAILLGATLPAAAGSYSIPKDDWRAAAQHVVAGSPGGTIVISLGDYSDWAVLSLGYYFRELNAPVSVIDGAQISSDKIGSLQKSTGRIWGVLNHPSPDQLALLSSSGVEATDFVDVTHTIYLVRGRDPAASPLEQARQLLRWESSVQHALLAPAALLDLSTGTRSLGPNLVPAPVMPAQEGWAYSSGAGATDGVITLSPARTQADASWPAHDLSSDGVYVLAFDHRRSGGWQSVYATALDASGRTITTFPSGAGFSCAESRDWVHSYFAFQVPSNTASVTIDFRAGDSSSAEFQSISLTRIQ